VEHEERGVPIEREAAAGYADRLRVHGRPVGRLGVDPALGQNRAAGPVGLLLSVARGQKMVVGRQVAGGERRVLRPTGLAEVVIRETGALARLRRVPAAQVGEGEVRLAVAAVGRAEQREERGVLRDRQDLSVAEGPALRGEVVGNEADLTEKWATGYGCPPPFE
jgi:hypothetical protein